MLVVITTIISVIGFIYFVGFFSQGTSFIKSQTEAACLKNPKLPFCEEGSEVFQGGGLAAYSTEALTCAINSVATGEEQACVKDKFSDPGIPIGDAGLKTEDSEPKTASSGQLRLPTVECKQRKYPEIAIKGFEEFDTQSGGGGLGDVQVTSTEGHSIRYRFNKDSSKWEVGIDNGWEAASGSLTKTAGLDKDNKKLIYQLMDSYNNERRGFFAISDFAKSRKTDVSIAYPDGSAADLKYEILASDWFIGDKIPLQPKGMLEIEFRRDSPPSVWYRFNPFYNSWEFKKEAEWKSVWAQVNIGNDPTRPFERLVDEIKGKDEAQGLKFLPGFQLLKSAYTEVLFHYPDGTAESINQLAGESLVPDKIGKIIEKANELREKEEKKVQTCNVKDFNLPQEFEEYGLKMGPIDATTDFNWIAAAGDPKYVVYSNVFPAGQEKSWSGQSAWYKDFGNVMFTGICLSHGLKLIKPIIAPFTTLKNYLLNKKIQNLEAQITALEKIVGQKAATETRLAAAIAASGETGVAAATGTALMNKTIIEKINSFNETELESFLKQNNIEFLEGELRQINSEKTEEKPIFELIISGKIPSF
ncbi:MAG: hypothetical protein HZB66_01340, partial [Candidatus Aenigmarchaeota archaeon]|nr:hypothetical protein [Candidatus Aenigmarchaeota archaeon]